MKVLRKFLALVLFLITILAMVYLVITKLKLLGIL